MRLPIRLRLTLIFSAGMALLLVAVGAFVYNRLGADLLESMDLGLRSRAQVIVDAVGRAPDDALGAGSGALIDPDEAFAQVLDGSGRLLSSSPGTAGAPLLTAEEAAALSEPVFLTRRVRSFDDEDRLLAVVVDGPPRRIVVVGGTLGDMNDALQGLLVLLGTVGPAALLATAGAGWLLAGAALRPVEQMRREAAAVSASEPARRLPVPATGDELARLASTLNSMLDRLQEALERERRFVDDASHELRTPLATLRAEIDLALARERSAPELEGALRSAQEDVERLQRLTADLLVLARSRGGRVPVRPVPTSLAALVGSSVQTVDRQARAAGVDIVTEAPDEAVEVDPERIQQALRNLLENAIRHAPRGGTVRVTAVRADGGARFVVTDSGTGFPPDLLPRAFEPFSRGDGDDEGHRGAGLGLAIVRAVAQAHGGSASAENLPGGGARVTLEVRT